MRLQIILVSVLFLALMVFADPIEFSIAARLWNAAFAGASILVGVLLFNRLWFSTLFATGFFLCLLGADRAKFYFMDDHLRWSDMLNITRHFDTLSGLRQFVVLMGQYAAGFMTLQNGAILLAGCAILAMFFRLEPAVFKGEHRFARARLRLGSGLAGLVALVVLAPPLARTTYLTVYGPNLKASDYARVGSPMFFFASKERLGLGSDYGAAQAATPPVSETIEPFKAGERPDIIVWFNESTFDPQDIAQVRGLGLEGTFGLFGANDHTIQFGRLDVGIFGGKSWNTVFALQAGAPVSWYSDDTYAASFLSGRAKQTFFRRLKAHGYEITALYAQDGYLFDAAKSQFDYGADRFFGSDFIAPADQKIGRATDAETLTALKRLMDEPSDAPRAYFVFTMQNHGPYPSKAYKASAESRARWGDLPLGVLDYLDRLDATQDVMEDLSQHVQAQNTPTLLLHLGDHKPRIADVTFGPVEKYQTYFRIEANFQPATEIAPQRDTDIVFLAGTLLELSQIATGPLFAANRTLDALCAPTFAHCGSEGQKALVAYRAQALENMR